MALERVGLVVHPRRRVDGALAAIERWASSEGIDVGQVEVEGQSRSIAQPVEPASCDLVIALGGDGTTLAALHAGARASRPVLGVACGSIGVLTSVAADDLSGALEQVAAGDWTPRAVEGLDVTTGDGPARVAVNDVAVLRAGIGQLIVAIHVDGELYARIAGDGLVVATPLGSSAYTMAAGGPILAAGTMAVAVTPLSHHGGVVPPLVVADDTRLSLSVEPGYGGGRLEIDGQELPTDATELAVSLRREYSTLVSLGGQESQIAGLRRRGLVTDSPRILARDAREHRPPP
jgi:NAD+ kinase